MLAIFEQQVDSSQGKIIKIKQLHAKEAEIMAHSDLQQEEISLALKNMPFIKDKFCKEMMGNFEQMFESADSHKELNPIMSEKIRKRIAENVHKGFDFDPVADSIQEI